MGASLATSGCSICLVLRLLLPAESTHSSVNNHERCLGAAFDDGRTRFSKHGTILEKEEKGSRTRIRTNPHVGEDKLSTQLSETCATGSWEIKLSHRTTLSSRYES